MRFRRAALSRDRMRAVVRYIFALPCIFGLCFFSYLQYNSSSNLFTTGAFTSVHLRPGRVVKHTRKVVLIGPPGVGKSTYGRILARKWKVPFIAMSQLLKEIKGPHADTISRHQKAGTLVPDNIVWEVLQQRLLKHDTKHGFFLDGFPRTASQSVIFDAHVRVDGVLNLDMPDLALKAVALGRRVCKCPDEEDGKEHLPCQFSEECDGIYNVADFSLVGLNFPTMKPKSWGPAPGISKTSCGCKGTLLRRADDAEDIVGQRIKMYREKSPALISHYRKKGVLASFIVKNGLSDILAMETVLARTVIIGKNVEVKKVPGGSKRRLLEGDEQSLLRAFYEEIEAENDQSSLLESHTL